MQQNIDYSEHINDFIDAEDLQKKMEELRVQMKQVDKDMLEEEPGEDLYKPSSDCFGEITCVQIFKKQMKYLNSLECRLKDLQEEAKEIRPIIADLKARIQVYMVGPLSDMKGEEVEKVNLKEERVKYTLKKSKRSVSSISKKQLPKSLTRYLVEVEKMSEENAKKKATAMMDFFQSICKKVEKTNLVRKNI